MYKVLAKMQHIGITQVYSHPILVFHGHLYALALRAGLLTVVLCWDSVCL